MTIYYDRSDLCRRCGDTEHRPIGDYKTGLCMPCYLLLKGTGGLSAWQDECRLTRVDAQRDLDAAFGQEIDYDAFWREFNEWRETTT